MRKAGVWPGSTLTRMVLAYGTLSLLPIIIMSVIFYFGTIGTLDQNIDARISTLSERLYQQYRSAPQADLVREVQHQLTDGFDSDREIFLLASHSGVRLAGNLSSWDGSGVPVGRPVRRSVVRNGLATDAQLIVCQFDDGSRLVVGHDLVRQEAIRTMAFQSLALGGVLSLLLVAAGALFLRRQIAQRIFAIRHAANAIAAGDLQRRIPVTDSDEFSLLSRDINHMLDQIEQLMEGVRHVSNAIAHDLRTPLGRIRSRLDAALHQQPSLPVLTGAATQAIEDIDGLIKLFERLLHIAEAEAGVGSQFFEPVDLQRIVQDMVDMYDDTADEQGIVLSASFPGAPVWVTGDRNLLASAVASLIDNAIKYAGDGASVEVWCDEEATHSSIGVRDNGPGIPEAEYGRVVQRFYRIDKSRHLPGNGVGLAIVRATALLHHGELVFSPAAPGLIVQLRLPRPAG
ncbi:MAG: HAMP domain-containing histidine kinase [Pseudomonadota bacterium]|nr:HAMP domain-containing histidine kinase [Pseudomonadota bacterium]